ncbi:MAG: PKD domain-containing protein [Paludibacteraceae bacterium]|nr:PKD domain-containing protein [Paludibacteraceae bacterium]
MALLLCRCSLGRVSAVCAYMLMCAAVAAQSPYISKVYEYRPAPGQFVNLMPEYTEGDTEETMRAKAEGLLCNPDSGSICLGGWGGYVVFGFDHTVVNRSGEYDFRILGNAFYADKNDPTKGGSSEPGVVYVSRDDNGNGLPDDTWYELAGSEYQRSTRNYQLTYFRTPDDHKRTPKPTEDLVDTTYILWRDLNGVRGYITQNRYHLQNYWPQWIDAERMVFTGTLLPQNAVSYKEEGKTKYILHNYQYGYADNHPNDQDGSKMNIDWAVNSKGEQVALSGIDFVKVQTGVNQQCGWIGETSTEVAGAVDLHPKATPTSLAETQHVVDNEYIVETEYIQSLQRSAKKVIIDGRILIVHDGRTYDLSGQEQ